MMICGIRIHSKFYVIWQPSGVTDDDLRETAYEILVACAGAAG